MRTGFEPGVALRIAVSVRVSEAHLRATGSAHCAVTPESTPRSAALPRDPPVRFETPDGRFPRVGANKKDPHGTLLDIILERVKGIEHLPLKHIESG
jgi:hypothetical protein